MVWAWKTWRNLANYCHHGWLYGFDTGEVTAIVIAAIAAIVALVTLGGRGLILKIVTWIVLIGLLALCGTVID